jgi:hypothetical protein
MVVLAVLSSCSRSARLISATTLQHMRDSYDTAVQAEGSNQNSKRERLQCAHATKSNRSGLRKAQECVTVPTCQSCEGMLRLASRHPPQSCI